MGANPYGLAWTRPLGGSPAFGHSLHPPSSVISRQAVSYDGDVATRKQPKKKPLTRAGFHKALKKVSRPVRPKRSRGKA